MQLEIDRALAMKKFIREEIGAKQMISHTALLFGGIVGARREFIVSDVVDTHGYWHHPHFPHKSWDMSDWEINNVSQIAAEDGGTLAEMAMQRPVGKPYSVSEYDTPAPNDYAAETFPLLAAMACLQDWSAVYHFDFKGSEKYDSDKITSFFDLPGHPGKQAFMPLAALVFRKGLIAPSKEDLVLPLPVERILDYTAEKAGDVWGGWRDVWRAHGLDGRAAWRTGPRFDLRPVDGATRPVFRSHRERSGGPAVALVRESDGGLEVMNMPSLINDRDDQLIATRGGATILGGKHLAVELRNNPWTPGLRVDELGKQSLLVLAPVDGELLEFSKKLWLCALSRAENQGMGWDNDRRTVGNKWGTGPALVLGVKAQIKLPGDANWKVEALDPTGAPKAVIAEKTNEFRIDPSQKTVWWLITRP